MKYLFFLLTISYIAIGYGYWDINGEGGRVVSLSPFSSALGGATLPDESSASQVFTNPSGLARLSRSCLSVSGWGTGWREEITYDIWCLGGPYRFNEGGMSPRGSLALAFPLGNSLTAGAGIATVSQYEMLAIVQVFTEVSENKLQLHKILTSEGTGDQHEALFSIAGQSGRLRLGVSSGIRFGSGETTTYSDRTDGSQYDSTFHETWEISELAIRAGASATLGYTQVYSTFNNGGERYKSYMALGSAASFPFMKGGFLGTEIGLYDGSEIRVAAYSKMPWIIPCTTWMLGISGYRPEAAYKMGMGFSCGLDYVFGHSRISGVYSWNSRFREGCSVPIDYINWVYDSGESIIVGFEQSF